MAVRGPSGTACRSLDPLACLVCSLCAAQGEEEGEERAGPDPADDEGPGRRGMMMAGGEDDDAMRHHGKGPSAMSWRAEEEEREWTPPAVPQE